MFRCRRSPGRNESGFDRRTIAKTIRRRRFEADAEVVKIVLIGDSGVGKTALLVRLRQAQFDVEEPVATVGVDFFEIRFVVQDTPIRVQIWDTAGQEKYRAILPTYLKNSHGCMLVYDVTSQSSFDAVPYWSEFYERNVRNEDCVKMLAGNKCDLVFSRAVSRKDGRSLAQAESMSFVETSAVDGTNVVEGFCRLVERIVCGNGPTVTSYSNLERSDDVFTQPVDMCSDSEPNFEMFSTYLAKEIEKEVEERPLLDKPEEDRRFLSVYEDDGTVNVIIVASEPHWPTRKTKKCCGTS